MSDLKWWAVCDFEIPDYGAIMVLASSEKQALERGCIIWYDKIDENYDYLSATHVNVPVTEEQVKKFEKQFSNILKVKK